MKKTIFLTILAIGLIFLMLQFFFNQKKSSLTSPTTNLQLTSTEISPSKTSKSYTDPAGFSFNYPDNLSLKSNETTNPTAYADIQLTSKEVAGSLSLKISDSNFASVEEWLKANNPSSQTPKEVKLSNLKALEIITGDRLLLGSIDQGILFTIEMYLKEGKDFWMNVYGKILADFAFSQEAASASDVVFEGEEVIE